MALGKNIRELREARHIRQEKLAEQAGMSQQALNALETRDSKSSSFAPALAAALGVGLEQLLGVAALPVAYPSAASPPLSLQSLAGLQPVGQFDEDDPRFVTVRKVRLRLSAGIHGFAVDDLDGEDSQPLAFRRRWLDANGYRADRLIGVQVRGDSMQPRLYDGDTVVINTADTTPRDGDVYAVNYEGEAVIKRLVRDAGEWWLSSDNIDQRRFPRKLCQGDMCLIIGKVVHKQSDRI